GNVRRDAQNAGRGVEGHSSRQIPPDVKIDDARGSEPGSKDRRTAQAGEYGLLRYHVDALSARSFVANGYLAMAGWNPRSKVEESCFGARRISAWATGIAPVPREQMARDRDDPYEPQRHEDGCRGLRRARGGERKRGGHACEAGAQGRHGCDQHETRG